MKAWAVRQKSTGLFIPFPKSSRCRTGAKPGEGPPRLFSRKGSATYFMKMYGQGVWGKRFDPLTMEDLPGIEPLNTGRNPNDYEVVELELREVQKARLLKDL